MTVKLTDISKTNPVATIVNESGLYSLVLLILMKRIPSTLWTEIVEGSGEKSHHGVHP